MSTVADSLKLLEEKLEDLQRDTMFCFNNYDYHHRDKEHEILQSIQDILKESLKDGERFLSYVENVRSLINKAREKCSEIDELLTNFHSKSVTFEGAGSYSGSHSFREEQETDLLEESEENCS